VFGLSPQLAIGFAAVAGCIGFLMGRIGARRQLRQLAQMARVDSVTGLCNASAYEEALDNEIERARRSGSRLGVLVGEVDDRSAIHAELLASAGAIFHTTTRQIDTAAHLGRGRFAMVLPYTDEHGAYLVAERIRQRTGALPSGGIPMSMGVAGFPRSGANGHAVLHAAEAALAEARAAGGDRVILLQRVPSTARVEIDLSALRERQVG
jgi:diguanylate cyclase (GGDEF)-like protein